MRKRCRLVLTQERQHTLSTPQIPSADQLAAARSSHWHQAGEPLVTMEALRGFLGSTGLVLFAPRPQHVIAPAPSLVEATLGAANAAPSLAETDTARSLLSRLIIEGTAVPLNLLGAAGTSADGPDFVASAQVFSYIFTLRGDKAWKQPPANSGATKVSPLALNTFTLLTEKGSATAPDLANELGKGLTEAAVLRALNELWQHLRVFPIPQANGAATIWELASTRLTKQIKAGANAGQPSALSALVSLYLGSALLATEEEIETFLSPLAPRSRIRGVIHDLAAGRQLETVVIEGKHHLQISGSFLPEAGVAATSDEVSDATDPTVEASEPNIEEAEDGSRIRKFIPQPKKIGTGYIGRAKPFATGDRPASGDRERRPFNRDDRAPGRRDISRSGGDRPVRRSTFGASSRPSFDKPWEEEKQARADLAADRSTNRAAARSDEAPGGGMDTDATPEFQDVDLDAGASPASRPAPSRPDFERSRPSRPGFAKRPSFGDKPRFGDRPRPGSDRFRPGGDRPSFGSNRPSFGKDRPGSRDRFSSDRSSPDRSAAGSRPGFAGKSSKPRDRSAGGDRPSFGARPSFGDRPRPPFRRDTEGQGGDRPGRPFAPRSGDDTGSRPPRPGFAGKSFTSRDRSAGGDRPGFSDRPRTNDRPRSNDRPSFGGRPPFGDRPRPPFRRDAEGQGGDRPRRTFSDSSSNFNDRPRREFTPREGSGARPPFGSDRPGKPRFSRDGAEGGGRPPFRKFDAPRGPRKPFTPREGSGGEGESRPPRRDFAAGGKPPFGTGARKPFVKREGGFAGKREGGSGFSGRREGAGGFAGKKSFGKPGFAGKPGRAGAGGTPPGGSTFDKFKGPGKGGNKPWGKRPPPRKIKPEGESET